MDITRQGFRVILGGLALLALALQGCDQQHEKVGEADWPSEYVSPIEGATFSLGVDHLPNAERSYRDGVHQGFDFFDGMSSVPADEGTPVVAVAGGEVVRIDAAHTDLSDEVLSLYAELASHGGDLGAFALDKLRGRQVWLLHDGGYLSRYSHLQSVNDELEPGRRVDQGDPLGTVGRSGMREDERSDLAIPHLHFELWSPDGQYFGEGRGPLEIHRLLGEVFGQSALPRYSRRILAQTADGEVPAEEFPPDPLPDVGLRISPPGSVTVGSPFAISMAWDDDAIRPEDVVVAMGNRPLGIIDGGAGVWLIGVAQTPGADSLIIGAVDQYGQTLSGARQIEVSPIEDKPAPLVWSPALVEQYSEERIEQEEDILLLAAEAAYEERNPYWEEPFMGPLNGLVVGTFGQAVTSGEEALSSYLLPGLYLMPDEPGSTVRASNRGQVVFADEMPLRGKTVVISHGGGVVSVYAHLDEIHVGSDNMVERGQDIGLSGTSGAMDQEVLRWEIHVTGVPSDPLGWLDKLLPQQY